MPIAKVHDAAIIKAIMEIEVPNQIPQIAPVIIGTEEHGRAKLAITSWSTITHVIAKSIECCDLDTRKYENPGKNNI